MLEVIVMENDMEQNLTILTERQRQVYLLRAQKLTFAAIGTQLGVSAAAAGSAYRAACRRLRLKYVHLSRLIDRMEERHRLWNEICYNTDIL